MDQGSCGQSLTAELQAVLDYSGIALVLAVLWQQHRQAAGIWGSGQLRSQFTVTQCLAVQLLSVLLNSVLTPFVAGDGQVTPRRWSWEVYQDVQQAGLPLDVLSMG